MLHEALPGVNMRKTLRLTVFFFLAGVAVIAANLGVGLTLLARFLFAPLAEERRRMTLVPAIAPETVPETITAVPGTAADATVTANVKAPQTNIP